MTVLAAPVPVVAAGSAADVPVLEVDGLAVRLFRRDAQIAAVNGVSFALARGETLTILGELGVGQERHVEGVDGVVAGAGAGFRFGAVGGDVGSRSAAGGVGAVARAAHCDDFPGADVGA